MDEFHCNIIKYLRKLAIDDIKKMETLTMFTLLNYNPRNKIMILNLNTIYYSKIGIMILNLNTICVSIMRNK